MTQFNLDTPINAATKTGSVLASDLSAWRDSLHTSHNGTSRPSYAQNGMVWTNFTPGNPVVYMVDGANDIVLGVIINATNRFIPGASAATLFGDIKQGATTESAGVLEIATGPEALAGTDNARAVTSLGLASGQTKASTGHTTLPGGIIMNWGSGTCPGEGSQARTFNLTFPNNIWSLVTSPVGTASGGGSQDFWGYDLLTTAGFTQYNKYNGEHDFTYIALGN